jgi:sarcosine oxidase subunit gamma
MTPKENVSMANAAIAHAERNNPVAGNKFANAHVTIEALPAAARINFRATSKGAKDFGKALGLDLPTQPMGLAKKSGRLAVWIGPDEWLVVDDKKPIDELMPRRESTHFSATDISHRNVAFQVSGEGATNVLNTGCPRDLSLSAFPINSGSRTLLGKAEIVLIRIGRSSFRVECWRSFAPYLWELLVEGARGAQH